MVKSAFCFVFHVPSIKKGCIQQCLLGYHHHCFCRKTMFHMFHRTMEKTEFFVTSVEMTMQILSSSSCHINNYPLDRPVATSICQRVTKHIGEGSLWLQRINFPLLQPIRYAETLSYNMRAFQEKYSNWTLYSRNRWLPNHYSMLTLHLDLGNLVMSFCLKTWGIMNTRTSTDTTIARPTAMRHTN